MLPGGVPAGNGTGSALPATPESFFADDFAWGRERFLDEARALARFRHLHIVPVLRYFEANDTAYTVMEFEDGRSVAQLLRTPNHRLQPGEVRRLAEGLLSGLHAVHAQGFLHRDIKPSNIIVRSDGVPVLIDFGAARQAMGGRTRTLTSILTPQYAPIEQYALDGKQGPWSDIYSTAAVLHHAIAGFPPPDAASRVGEDPYRPLSVTHANHYDSALLAAVDRGLAFTPTQRPQTIEAWRPMFGAAIPAAEDAPTERLQSAPSAAPRLGGASRADGKSGEAAGPPPARQSRFRRRLPILLLALAIFGIWKYQVQIRERLTGAPTVETQTAAAPPIPVAPPKEQPKAAPAPNRTAPDRPVPAPAATPTSALPPVTTADPSVQKALIDQAKRLMVAYMPYKVHAHRIWTDMAQPWVKGYHRNIFVREFWKYVDVDMDERNARLRPCRGGGTAIFVAPGLVTAFTKTGSSLAWRWPHKSKPCQVRTGGRCNDPKRLPQSADRLWPGASHAAQAGAQRLCLPDLFFDAAHAQPASPRRGRAACESLGCIELLRC